MEYPVWDKVDKWEEIAGERLTKRVTEKAGFKSAKCASCKNLIHYMTKGDEEGSDNLLKFNCTHWIFTSGCVSGYSPYETDKGEEIGTDWLDVTTEMLAANADYLKQIREEAEVHKFSDERKAFQSVLDDGWPKLATETPGITPQNINMNDIAAARDMVSL
jgi:hypothetical protein